MKNFIRIILEGAFTNFKRIFFAADRVTDIEVREAVLDGKVVPTEKVAKIACIGCGGCANVCPTQAIRMKDLDEPVEIMDGITKTQLPELDSMKCVYCYYCHDFCPIYALFGESGTIHPNDVGKVDANFSELMQKPFKISEDKLAYINKLLMNKSVLKKRKQDSNNK